MAFVSAAGAVGGARKGPVGLINTAQRSVRASAWRLVAPTHRRARQQQRNARRETAAALANSDASDDFDNAEAYRGDDEVIDTPATEDTNGAASSSSTDEADEKPAANDNPLYDVLSQYPPSELVERFRRSSSPEVQTAFHTTVRNIIGSLPASLYEAQVRTVAGSLLQLMHTCTMTGYLMRSAQYRLSLMRSVGGGGAHAGGAAPQLPSLSEVELSKALKNGKAVFTKDSGRVEEVDAEEYVEKLRAEADSLRKELTRLRLGVPGGGNELVAYIGQLNAEQTESLAKDADPQVVEAMQQLIHSVLGIEPQVQANPMVPVQTNKTDLGKLLLYTLVSGYFLREVEMSSYVGDKLEMSAKLPAPLEEASIAAEPQLSNEAAARGEGERQEDDGGSKEAAPQK